jgi:hypothetical protein
MVPARESGNAEPRALPQTKRAIRRVMASAWSRRMGREGQQIEPAIGRWHCESALLIVAGRGEGNTGGPSKIGKFCR